MSGNRAEVLARLDVFVGEWVVEAEFPGDRPTPPDTTEDGRKAHSWFEWTLDGQFLLQRIEIPMPEVPDSLSIISADAGTGSYTQHYFDSRGVARLYAMSLTDRVWTLTRESPDFMPLEFGQRFAGTFSQDWNSVRGAWEKRFDGGGWEHDFALTYRRVG
jgi:hypothetical protein